MISNIPFIYPKAWDAFEKWSENPAFTLKYKEKGWEIYHDFFKSRKNKEFANLLKFYRKDSPCVYVMPLIFELFETLEEDLNQKK